MIDGNKTWEKSFGFKFRYKHTVFETFPFIFYLIFYYCVMKSWTGDRQAFNIFTRRFLIIWFSIWDMLLCIWSNSFDITQKCKISWNLLRAFRGYFCMQYFTSSIFSNKVNLVFSCVHCWQEAASDNWLPEVGTKSINW